MIPRMDAIASAISAVEAADKGRGRRLIIVNGPQGEIEQRPSLLVWLVVVVFVTWRDVTE